MRFVKQTILLFFIILSVFLCCSDEKNDTIKFWVICYPGNFSGGIYKLNGGATKLFSGTRIQTGSDTYEYEESFHDLDSLYFNVSKAANTQEQTLKVKIFREESIVKSWDIESNEHSSGSTTEYKMTLEDTYEYGEEDTTPDTTPTTTPATK